MGSIGAAAIERMDENGLGGGRHPSAEAGTLASRSNCPDGEESVPEEGTGELVVPFTTQRQTSRFPRPWGADPTFEGSLQSPSGDSLLVFGEVLGRLVVACALLLELHEYIVKQRAGSKAKPLWAEPRVTERLFDDDEVMER